VPDRDDDPAVVAIEVAGRVACAGALIAPDIVLTAGRCLMMAMPPVQCPAGTPIANVSTPASIRVLVADVGAVLRERASAGDLLVASADADCRADLAFVFLDTALDEVVPLSVRTTGAARGDWLRTVGFVRHGVAPTLEKLVRDHIPVLDATATELLVGEPCTSEGGPAVDEMTGEVVGIALRAGDGACAGATPAEVYARTDKFLTVIDQVLSKSGGALGSTRGKKRTKRGSIDMGASCAHGADCAAGVCVKEPTQEYCSRTCSPHDRCPAHFRCQKAVGELWVCVEH
jgi:hypothetical protein